MSEVGSGLAAVYSGQCKAAGNGLVILLVVFQVTFLSEHSSRAVVL